MSRVSKSLTSTGMALARHSTAALTIGRYTHLGAEDEVRTAEVVAEIFRSQNVTTILAS